MKDDHFLLGIFGGDGLMGLGRTALPSIESVTVENENIVQVCDYSHSSVCSIFQFSFHL